MDVVAALALQCSSSDAQAAMLAALRRVLDGSAEPRPRNAYERVGLVQALSSLAAAQGSGPSSTALAEEAVDCLCTCYRRVGPAKAVQPSNQPNRLLAKHLQKSNVHALCPGSRFVRAFSSCDDRPSCFMRRDELTEDVRLCIVAALGAWLSRLGAWPPAALSRLKDGLSEKEVLRRAHLRILVKVRWSLALVSSTGFACPA